MSNTQMTNRVLDETFEMSRIVGKSLAAISEMGLDFETSYPTVENGVVTGIVDGNHPDDFNGGNWEIIDDNYAVATNGADEQ